IPPRDFEHDRAEPTNIDLILDIELPLIVRLGEAEITVHDVLQLCPGSVIELNKSLDDPVDVIVNNKLVAKGEVVVVDSYFALKITEIKSHAERIKSLGKE
ncbi:flagellar motor switch protein FliN, partial [bacterium]|nr:flagellar motor switch protein FliN [bacterium]